jgi:hypothetical protein
MSYYNILSQKWGLFGKKALRQYMLTFFPLGKTNRGLTSLDKTLIYARVKNVSLKDAFPLGILAAMMNIVSSCPYIDS